MFFFMFMFFTITMSYRGSLNAVLTVTYFPKPINTIAELATKVSYINSLSYATHHAEGVFNPNPMNKKMVTDFGYRTHSMHIQKISNLK
jgi:hypothetical protein